MTNAVLSQLQKMNVGDSKVVWFADIQKRDL